MSFNRAFSVLLVSLSLSGVAFSEDIAANMAVNPTENGTEANQAIQLADATALANQNDQSQVTTHDSTKLNVNQATAKQLMKIKGISSAKAKAIVAYRKKHGDFKSLDQLREVRGLKKMNDSAFQAVADQLTI